MSKNGINKFGGNFMFIIKDHEYDLYYSTPLSWLNDMFGRYGESSDFEDFDSALEFALFLGDDFLNFCDEVQKQELKSFYQSFINRWNEVTYG